MLRPLDISSQPAFGQVRSAAIVASLGATLVSAASVLIALARRADNPTPKLALLRMVNKKPQGFDPQGLSVLLYSALERGCVTLSLVFGHSNDSTFDARFVSAAPWTQSNTRRVACSITHFRCTSAYGRLGGLGDASAKIGGPNISIPYLMSSWSCA